MSNRSKVIVVGFNDQALGLEYISGLRNKFNNSSWVPIEPMNPFEFETPNHIIKLITKDACGRVDFIRADYVYGPEWLRTKVRAFEGHTYEYSLCPPNLVEFIERHETAITKLDLNSLYVSGIYNDGNRGRSVSQSVAHPKPDSCLACEQRASIKKVHFSGPVTCVIWTDGTKTLVRCQDGETLDPEKGLAMAISKKMLGTNATGSNYYDEFHKWLPKKEEKKSFEIPHVHTSLFDGLVAAQRNFEELCKALGKVPFKRETCRERLKREHPEFVGPDHLGGCYSCPHKFGYTTKTGLCQITGCMSTSVKDALCAKCWDRPVEIRSGSKPWGEKNPKFELTTETKEFMGRTLHRIRALRNIYLPAPNEKQKPILFVKKGTLGGWVEKEKNLSHDGSCWVGEDAHVMEEAVVKGSAYVYGHAVVRKKARVEHNAIVCGHAIVQDNAIVGDEAYVHDEAIIRDNAIVSHNANVGGMSDIGDNVIVSRDCILTRNLVGRGSYTYEGVKME